MTANEPRVGDLLTLTDGLKCKLHGLPETRPRRRPLGWRVSYWDRGTEVTRVIKLEEIKVNHSRPQ